MSWFKSKKEKTEPQPQPRYHVNFWNRCDGSIINKDLNVIPRVGERVTMNDVFDVNSKCIFYTVTNVYHYLENNMIIIILDEPP